MKNHACFRKIPTATSHFLVVLVILCSFLPLTATNAHAYDIDTHFWLTYYLARQAGFNRMQAAQIAAADLSVDYNSETTPVFPRSMHPQDVRSKLHALASAREVDNCRERLRNQRLSDEETDHAVRQCVKGLLDVSEKALWNDALRIGNPGVFMHFFQDKYAHENFFSRIGHARRGHYPDFLSSDTQKSQKMAEDSVKVLRKFLEEYDKDYWRGHPLPPSPDMEKIRQVVAALIAIKSPSRRGVPDSYQASKVIENAMIGDRPPPIWTYSLNESGLPTAEMSTTRWMYPPGRTSLWKTLQSAGRIPWKLVGFDFKDSPDAFFDRD